MAERLPRRFYCQPTLKIAEEILGKVLVHRLNHKRLAGKIVEVEAYIGPDDKASHAYQGKITNRNRAEYLIGGHVYIYLVYGIYWQFNISTAQAGKPECILIRALEPLEGITEMQRRRKTYDVKNLTNGPGKLCQALGFDRKCYGVDLVNSQKIWIEDPESNFQKNKEWSCLSKSQIVTDVRIGIDYAGSDASKPWRFYIKDNPFVSIKKSLSLT